jgi:hypothetical protein
MGLRRCWVSTSWCVVCAKNWQLLLTLLGQVAARPGASLPEAYGSRGQLKAAAWMLGVYDR